VQGKSIGARYQKSQEKESKLPFYIGFNYSFVLFFLRLNATPKPTAVIEPRIVNGSGTAAGAEAEAGLSSTTAHVRYSAVLKIYDGSVRPQTS
jgi:hypothetical protein